MPTHGETFNRSNDCWGFNIFNLHCKCMKPSCICSNIWKDSYLLLLDAFIRIIVIKTQEIFNTESSARVINLRQGSPISTLMQAPKLIPFSSSSPSLSSLSIPFQSHLIILYGHIYKQHPSHDSGAIQAMRWAPARGCQKKRVRCKKWRRCDELVLVYSGRSHV